MSQPERPGPLPKSVQAVVALLCTVVALHGWLTYSGLFRWLAEWQLADSGSYSVTLNILLILVTPYFTLLLLAGVVSRLRGGSWGINPQRQWEGWDQWVQERKLRLGALGLGIAFVGIGAHRVYVGSTSGELARVRVADVEAWGRPRSTWLEVSGRVLTDAEIVLKERARKTHYLPLVSEEWSPGLPVSAFLEIRDSDYSRLTLRPSDVQDLRGFVAATGMPGAIRVRFEESGLRPTEDYLLIEYGEDPSKKVILGWILLIGGSVTALAAALIWALMAAGDTHSTQPEPSEP